MKSSSTLSSHFLSLSFTLTYSLSLSFSLSLSLSLSFSLSHTHIHTHTHTQSICPLSTAILSGKELFNYNSSLFVDDEGAIDASEENALAMQTKIGQ